jgi:hypothetical protein
MAAQSRGSAKVSLDDVAVGFDVQRLRQSPRHDAPMPQVHHEWLAKWSRELAEEYERLHAGAAEDPQRSGHGGEASWLRLLQEWLPPAYAVGTRKYIVPEDGNDTFETDLVIFNPAYPQRLREREEVLAGGVAAAFSVKLTLDAGGLRDGVDRGARLKRSMKPRLGTPRDELLGPFAFGVLAHSHGWNQPSSTPRENLERNLVELSADLVHHPREQLDFVCVANLTTVTTTRLVWLPSDTTGQQGGSVRTDAGDVLTGMGVADEADLPGPLAVFISALIMRLAYFDPSIEPFANALRLTGTFGAARGQGRRWRTADVYSELVRKALPDRALAVLPPVGGTDPWGPAFI